MKTKSNKIEATREVFEKNFTMPKINYAYY